MHVYTMHINRDTSVNFGETTCTYSISMKNTSSGCTPARQSVRSSGRLTNTCTPSAVICLQRDRRKLWSADSVANSITPLSVTLLKLARLNISSFDKQDNAFKPSSVTLEPFRRCNLRNSGKEPRAIKPLSEISPRFDILNDCKELDVRTSI